MHIWIVEDPFPQPLRCKISPASSKSGVASRWGSSEPSEPSPALGKRSPDVMGSMGLSPSKIASITG